MILRNPEHQALDQRSCPCAGCDCCPCCLPDERTETQRRTDKVWDRMRDLNMRLAER